jgi:drug/metabolite transporter (DMT)-like permease
MGQGGVCYNDRHDGGIGLTVAALGLVLTAAVAHATWNLLLKRAGGGGVFVWLSGWVSAALYAPLAAAVALLLRPHFGWIQWVFIAGTVAFHGVYFLMLQRAYAVGELSLVYPLSRGTGPLLSAAAAIAWLGERPGPVGVAGIVLIGAGVMILASSPPSGDGSRARRAVPYALAIGAVIAAYTLWDKRAVTALAIPPILYEWCGDLGRAIVLTPIAAVRRAEVRALWASHRADVIGTGVLSPLAYILVLTALVFTPVSYVAPAREVSILIGTLMGARLLAEEDARRRIVAAAAMLVGLAALVLG